MSHPNEPCEFCQRADEDVRSLRARVASVEKENTIIRGLLVKHECPYGEKSIGECRHGLPGCACADDLLATSAWCPEDEDKATVRLGRRVAELEAALAEGKAKVKALREQALANLRRIESQRTEDNARSAKESDDG